MSWDESDLGGYEGVGNDRPRGPAEIKPGLDPGLAVVRFIFDAMRIDTEWSTRDAHGFVWWGHEHAQRVWADAGRDDHGVRIFRVFASTEVLRGIGDDARAIEAIDRSNRTASTSALVLEQDAGTVDLVASMWVHAGTVDWVSRLFASVVALQAADAHALADGLASSLGAQVAHSAHPVSGPRTSPDEMLGVHRAFMAASGDESSWAGRDLVATLEMVRHGPTTVLVTGDESGLTAEFPFGASTSLLVASTKEAYPSLGHGLWLRLTLPLDAASVSPGFAADLNRRELESVTYAHALGSWQVFDGMLAHVAFLPNLARQSGSDVLNLVMSETGRARWVAGELEGDDWLRRGRLDEARRDWSKRWEPAGSDAPSIAGQLATRSPIERSEGNGPIRVLIVDDIALTTSYLNTLLSLEADIEVVGVAATADEALTAADELAPDVVLMDDYMPGMSSIDATAILTQRFPATGVVMVTINDGDAYLRRAMEAGAHELLFRPFSLEELLAAIRGVAIRVRQSSGTVDG
jgi:CheY-like chemotaxis protein